MEETFFYCPVCQKSLIIEPGCLACPTCSRNFPIVDGLADFYIVTGEADAIDEPNTTWLDPEVVDARDTIYRYCARELRGMAFCIDEMASRATPGSRVLEVGMGTGHFTRWLAESVALGVQIYAFDMSWPILKVAQVNIAGLNNVTLFRANSKANLPFPPASFDLILVRLAPFGPNGTPNVVQGYQYLKPGGWYFEASWERPKRDHVWSEWAIQNGYESAEQHTWHYQRSKSADEQRAALIESSAMTAKFHQPPPAWMDQLPEATIENLLIAQKSMVDNNDPVDTGSGHN